MVWVILLAGAVACSGRQIRTDQDLETAAKQAAAGKESGWQSLEGTVRNNGDDQDLEYQKRALTEIGKIQSPRGELILKENLTHRQLRGEAAQGLIHQRNEANKSQIDAALVESGRQKRQGIRRSDAGRNQGAG
jgi:hypothetical protein